MNVIEPSTRHHAQCPRSSLRYEVKLLLQWMIESACYFTLDDLNCCVESLELGYVKS